MRVWRRLLPLESAQRVRPAELAVRTLIEWLAMTQTGKVSSGPLMAEATESGDATGRFSFLTVERREPGGIGLSGFHWKQKSMVAYAGKWRAIALSAAPP
ncbi:hypothetical protein CWR43_26095 [Rhizobium sullae]|uniref:Uncharacterized protein n=1 Tax=Rhizobium sullae TaxID=50338 RepID=A0A2N0D3X9_RHISU|nr:hypothetical protein CWR43_26095 [Rhizobium sullae]